MDEDIKIINNKKKLSILILAILLIIFAFFFNQERIEKNKEKIANNYNTASINFLSGNKINVKNKMINVIESKDKTYSPLALYFLIDNNIIESKEEINQYFDILINQTQLEKEIKNLIIYKKALFNSEFETENNLLKILNPIINSESIWKSHSLYLVGEYFFSKNEKKKAKEFFEKILILENANPNIKLEVQKRIQRDFSE